VGVAAFSAATTTALQSGAIVRVGVFAWLGLHRLTARLLAYVPESGHRQHNLMTVIICLRVIGYSRNCQRATGMDRTGMPV